MEKQLFAQSFKKRIAVMQCGVGGVTKGLSVTYTLSDGKKIQNSTDVVTGTGSVVRVVRQRLSGHCYDAVMNY